jgi:hypothetical protein
MILVLVSTIIQMILIKIHHLRIVTISNN